MLCLAGVGCVSTKTATDSATELTQQLSAYRTQAKTRVDNANAEYHQAFSQLMDAYVDLNETLLQQQRDSDAQHIADKIIGDDKQTLIGAMRDAFQQTMVSQRTAITNADLAVAAARNAYLKSYSEAKVELTKLDKVISNLQALTKPEGNSNQFNIAMHIISMMGQTAIDAQNNAQAQAGKNTKSNAAQPTPPKIPTNGT